MPRLPPKPCTHHLCRDYAIPGQSRCANHPYQDRRGAWRQSNDKSRHERGYGSEWQRLRSMVMKRDKYLCRVCTNRGLLTKANQVDHIKPKSQGGSDDFENLQAICSNCHKIKTQSESRWQSL